MRTATPAPGARTRTPAPAVTRPAPRPAPEATLRDTTRREGTRRETTRRHAGGTHHSERSKPKPAAADRQRTAPYAERPYSLPERRRAGAGESGVAVSSVPTPAPIDPPGGGSADARLILQIGMLFSLVYVAFLCVWFRATRHLRGDGEEPVFALARRRLAAAWRNAFAGSGNRPQRQAPGRRDGSAPREADAQWTCEIAYQPGKLRFQAVMAPEDAAKEHGSHAKVLHWPRGVTKASARELETAMGALFASIAAAGWEPVHSGGVWSERRFVWKKAGEPPTNFELVGAGPIGAEADAARPVRPRAPRGANREAVLRAVAARPGLTLRELTTATGVKPSSLPPLLRTLTNRGELEKRRLPNGQTGYALARPTEEPAETRKELQAAP